MTRALWIGVGAVVLIGLAIGAHMMGFDAWALALFGLGGAAGAGAAGERQIAKAREHKREGDELVQKANDAAEAVKRAEAEAEAARARLDESAKTSRELGAEADDANARARALDREAGE